MGMALGRLFALDEAEQRVVLSPTWLVGGAISGLGIAAWYGPMLPYPLFHNALLAPLFCALVLGLARGGRGAGLLGSPTFVRLGEWSFALYIFQDRNRPATTVVTSAEVGVQLAAAQPAGSSSSMAWAGWSCTRVRTSVR